ncbi:MAG: pitrilysin family protein [Planctomycetota bacterium]
MPEIHTQTLESGLRVVAEPMPGAESVALSLLTPAGVASQPAGQDGVAPVLSEMILRGAGGKAAREHAEALDALGVHRATSAGTHHLKASATLLGRNLTEALPLILAMATRPNLEEDALGPAKDLAVQAIDGLQDEPQQQVVHELFAKALPAPWGRPSLGVRDHVEELSVDCVRAYWAKRCGPKGSILSVAGKVDWPGLLEQVEELTAGWIGGGEPTDPTAAAPGGAHHVASDSAQSHIALTYPAVPETDPDSLLQRAAVSILSGGMSGRLFSEVREKRGLCYSVSARYLPMRDRGLVMGYAGTTSARAQETLDVFVAELRRLSEGFDDGEFDRAVIGMKSRLVMQGESTGARAEAIAGDLFLRGRARTLDERSAEVAALDPAKLRAFVADRPVDDITLVTLGPAPLRAPETLAPAAGA